MTTHVALLRAINLAGKSKVAMADLRALFADLGFADAKTLLQTGNVIFAAGKATDAAFEARLEAETLKRLGLKTEFIVRSAAEWRGLIDANPFPDFAKADPAHLVAIPLKAAPAKGALEALRAAIKDREEVAVVGRDAYATYPDGIGRSRLSMTLIDGKLGRRGTGRNWNTVQKIAALLDA